MNIIIATTELAPFVKAGGLADITAFLPAEWQKFGQNPIIILPKYRSIDVAHWGFSPMDITLNVPMGYWTEYAGLWQGRLPGSNVPVYLIEYNEYFDRDGIYGSPDEYPDNDRRFIFFSRAVMETAKALNFLPDIIHAHDFHTAFTMAFLKTHYKYDFRFARTAGIFTIHNLAYQGWFSPINAMNLAGFSADDFYKGCWFEHYGMVNAMKTGIMFADKITTVSPNYAYEIRLPYYSEGLQDYLNLRGSDLIGVLNGVDYNEWSPEKDILIDINYNFDQLDLKRQNKINLLNSYGLNDEDNYDKPLIGMVSRLTEQKGIDLLFDKLEFYLYNNQFRFIVLGSGEKKYIDFFKYLQSKFYKDCLTYFGYNERLSHQIIASSDYLLMPSRFEPCGLTQMYALKYGTIPIVRQTGGLADTIKEYIPHTGDGNGFTFLTYNSDDLSYSIRRGLSIYNNQPHWDLIRKNAMNSDNSSAKAALEYLKVFKWALDKVR